MNKNKITIKDFINKSIGEWKSIRSTHSLAFQEFENTNSKILISELSIDSKLVVDLIKKFSFKLDPHYAINIKWEALSDWSVKEKLNTKNTILLFSKKDDFSGIVLRDKGYSELIHASSKFQIDQKGEFNLFTDYYSTICEERIAFLSQNIRFRYSIIKSKIHDSIIQTSHSSEIRKII